MYNSIYPNYVQSYIGINNRQISRKKDEEKNSQSSQSAEENVQDSNKNMQRSIPSKRGVFPNGEQTAIDYTKRKININQVLTDFKNTANAIGAPDDIKSEVFSYLGLIENQSQKENPNPQIIQSNLKNASQILDEYITNTLKKPSKVVENWVDALFLQQIDYKSHVIAQKEPEIQKFGEVEQVEVVPSAVNSQEIITQEEPQKDNNFYVPTDSRLRSMFIQAKKYAAIDRNEQALYSFEKVLDYAEEIGDSQTAAIVHYEQGRLYDGFNSIDDALYNYDRAIKQTSDNNIKARAHLSMGKIYDDFVKFQPAVEHYCAAVSFAGEADNLKLQTKALADLTQVHTDRYDKNNAFMFMDMANTIADETGSRKLIGITYTKSAKCCEKLNEKARALELYGKASGEFNTVQDYENLAKNYKSAADIMLGFGNKAKAKKLLSKAYIALQECNNNELKQEVVARITAL